MLDHLQIPLKTLLQAQQMYHEDLDHILGNTNVFTFNVISLNILMQHFKRALIVTSKL